MLPSDRARKIAARIAVSVIRQEVRSRCFMDLYLGASDQEQIAEEMCQLAARIEVLCAPGGILRPKRVPA